MEDGMKPVVLLVGRLPGVVGNVAKALEDMPIRWLGAHNRAEVIQQLDTEPGIACVVMGAGLDDTVRGDLVGVIRRVGRTSPSILRIALRGRTGFCPSPGESWRQWF
jgi:hypothetical protein